MHFLLDPMSLNGSGSPPKSNPQVSIMGQPTRNDFCQSVNYFFCNLDNKLTTNQETKQLTINICKSTTLLALQVNGEALDDGVCSIC